MWPLTRQGVSTSHSGAAHVAFERMKTLGPCDVRSFVAQSHTPCNRCVRFATTVASGHATLATKQDATLYLGRTFTGWIAPALPGARSGRDVRFIARPPHRTVRAAFPHTAPTSGV